MWLPIDVSSTRSLGGHQADSCHLLDPAVGQVDKVLALGAVTVTGLLLAKVVAAVVVLEYGGNMDMFSW